MTKKLLFIVLCLNISFSYGQDDCNSAIFITSGVYTVDMINGTEVPDPICANNGAGATAGEWYYFTPCEDAYVTVSTSLPQNAGLDTRFHIYSGSCGDLTCVSGDDDSGDGFLSLAAFDATGGTTYYLAFDNRWSSSGFDFELNEGEPPPPPPTSFTQQSISTSGSNLAVVDMNGDFLDDIVSISSTNVKAAHGPSFTTCCIDKLYLR